MVPLSLRQGGGAADSSQLPLDLRPPGLPFLPACKKYNPHALRVYSRPILYPQKQVRTVSMSPGAQNLD